MNDFVGEEVRMSVRRLRLNAFHRSVFMFFFSFVFLGCKDLCLRLSDNKCWR